MSGETAAEQEAPKETAAQQEVVDGTAEKQEVSEETAAEHKVPGDAAAENETTGNADVQTSEAEDIQSAAVGNATVPKVSNPEEGSAIDWNAVFTAWQRSGNWNQDLVTAAFTQVDYPTEQTPAQFVIASLGYAGVPAEAFPWSEDPEEWAVLLSHTEEKMYLRRGTMVATETGETEFVASAGDLVFFDTDQDQILDRVGIVYLNYYDNQNALIRIEVIEADADGFVRVNSYEPQDETILGYGILPENPDMVQQEAVVSDASAAETAEAANSVDPVDAAGSVDRVEAADSDAADQAEQEIAKSEDNQPEDPEAAASETNDSDQAGTVVYSTTEEETEDASQEKEVTSSEEAPEEEKTTLRFSGSRFAVTAVYGSSANLPEGTELVVREIHGGREYNEYLSQTEELVSEESDKMVSAAHFLDISFVKDGQEIEPEDAVDIRIEYRTAEELENGAEVKAVHFVEDQPAVLHEVTAEEEAGSVEAVAFTADSFSVYAIVYTVDFFYEVNGQMYEFSLPGGGFVSFTDLVQALGILDDENNEANEAETDVSETDPAKTQVSTRDAARRFAADVATIEFSSPELMWIGKADSKTTVRALKEANGLACEYSADVKEEQIAEINAQAVNAGDWALISLRAFDTEETLTVTMKNGNVFTVKVTDAQMKTMFLSDSGELYEVTVTYGDDAQIPDGSKLVVTEYDNTSEEYLAAWKSVTGNAADSAAAPVLSEEDSEEMKTGSFSLAVPGSEEKDEEITETEQKEENIIIAENVVPYTFGMKAFDLSIYDGEGNPVEPKAAVEVSILLKELPADVETEVLASSLAVQHLNESTGRVQVETVASVDDKLPGEIEVAEDSITADFTVDSFSTYTITWGNGGLNGQQIQNISTGDYIIYAQDAYNGNYYALVPSTSTNRDLTSVQLTNSNGQLSYSGSTNLYWHVTVNGNGDSRTFTVSYKQGNTTYYVYPTNMNLKTTIL